MRTNLMPEFEIPMRNRYYRVTKSFQVFALVGHSNSNSFYGSSMIYGNVYRRVTLTRGDEVHALAGGIFTVRKNGDIHPIRLSLSDKSPFEKVYYQSPEQWPLESLRAIEQTTATRPAQYPHQFPVMPAGKLFGRSIDSVIE